MNCPSTRKGYSDITSVRVGDNIINFQTLNTFTKKTAKRVGYNLWVSKLSTPQQIDYTSDYIITTSGDIFKNNKVVIDGIMIYFKTPPVYRLN